MTHGPSTHDFQHATPKGRSAARHSGYHHAQLFETAHRYFIILLAGLVIGWATGSYFPMAWAIGYIAVNLSYQAILLRARTRSAEISPLQNAIGFSLSVLVFASMIVFLWLEDGLVLKFTALSGLIGLGLHSLSRPQKVFWVTLADSVVILALYIFMGVTVFLAHPENKTLAILLMCLFCTSSYFVVSQWRAYKRAEAIKSAEQRLMRNREMEAMGRLTGGFAHDFNNILAAMRGNLDLYDEVTDPEEKRRILHEAQSATARAARLTQKLLTYSQKAVLRPSRVITGAFITEFVAMMGRNLPETVTLRLEIDDNPPPLLIDAQTLEMVLTNLVMNAADAIGEQIGEDGGPPTGEITLSCGPMLMPATSSAPAASEIRAGHYLRLAVQDTGAGIPEALLPHICEPFYSTKAVGRGSGLGLPMAQGFAEQSGGALRISNTEGSGALVELFLPLEGSA
ncbi:ATP-binding protein [Litorivita sp. NS0012-18]|uniref:sensor histidine kinase n=1 Tax=Litorivita sp. NS0012-18 TaxID=3127655 RepID=UPI003101B637